MKRIAIAAIALFSLCLTDSAVRAQENPQKEQPKAAALREEGPLARVQIVFAEYEGDKKVKSLPYSLLVRVGVDGKDGPWSKIRMGSRVPIVTSSISPNVPASIQYVDVGTNVDCFASRLADGRFFLSLTLERSWPETEDASDSKTASSRSEGRPNIATQPIIRQFRSDSSVILREGQALETNFATDPVTGKVIKIDVSLTLVK